MSMVSLDIPTVEANASDFQNLIYFIHKHEGILKQYGGIKIQPHSECRQSLKKRRTNLPSCSTVQQTSEINKDELIYSIKLETYNHKLSFDQSVSINENIFWQSLSYSDGKKRSRSNLSIFPNKSFYSTRPRQSYFDLNRLPKLSLLKIGGNKVLRHCVPSLLQAHAPGAIFPLSFGQHRLFSIDYHHQGGNRQWYIIPADQRQKLDQILKQQNSSICLEHQNLLLHPAFLDKYHIRCHRLIQHPNEFVVLAAGALAQGFAENASWHETIVFALPSWLQDGHATAQMSLCNCHGNGASIPIPLDTSQFRYELVQKWSAKNLSSPSNNNKLLSSQDDHNNTKNTMPITPTDTDMDLLDVLDELEMDTCSIEPFWQNNESDTFLTESLMPLSNQFLPELLISPISNCSCHDENNDNTPEKQSHVVQNNGIDSNQMIQSTKVNQKFTSENHLDEQFPSFDLMDFLPNTTIDTESTQYQTNEQNDIYQNHTNQEWDCATVNSTSIFKKSTKNPKYRHQTKDNYNTLYISGLRTQVCKKDLYRHFAGCTKVTLKRHQMPPYLKYAFVTHRTYSHAERNRRRPVNYRLFGSECRIDYASEDYNIRYDQQQPFTVVVTRIPENVTEAELRDVFVDCQSLKYYPGRTARLTQKHSGKTAHDKVLWGYAFLLYSNSQQATSVVQNSDQYRINGQPLHIDLYNTKKSSYSTTD